MSCTYLPQLWRSTPKGRPHDKRSFLESVLEMIGAHQVPLRLVQDGRFSKTRSSGLRNISFAMDSTGATRTPQQLLVLANDNKDQSLAKQLENLAIQSEFILGIPGS